MNMIKTAMLIGGMTALFLGVGFLLGGLGGAAIAFVVAIAMNGYAYWNSDTLALKAHGAQPVSRASAPDLYRMTEELARNADMPTPRLFVIPTHQPNAFATGRSPANGAVAVTEGLMRQLTREELAAVVAHELAHIKNRDTLTMTIAATFAGAITMMANFGLFYGGALGGSSENRNPISIVLVIAAALLAPLAAALVQMAISRTREYSADRLGAEICGDPMWLASALQRISGGAGRHEMASVEQRPSTAHLFIANPLSGRTFDGLFATHPPMARRIAALEAMAREQGGRSPARAADAFAEAPAAQRSGAPTVRRRGRSPWRR